MKKILFVMVGLFLLVTLFGCSSSPKTPILTEGKFQVVKDGLTELQDIGIFDKISYIDEGIVWVKSPFYLLSFEDKTTFAVAVYLYCQHENVDISMLFLRDYLTNKDIGTYTEVRGLRLD